MQENLETANPQGELSSSFAGRALPCPRLEDGGLT